MQNQTNQFVNREPSETPPDPGRLIEDLSFDRFRAAGNDEQVTLSLQLPASIVEQLTGQQLDGVAIKLVNSCLRDMETGEVNSESEHKSYIRQIMAWEHLSPQARNKLSAAIEYCCHQHLETKDPQAHYILDSLSPYLEATFFENPQVFKLVKEYLIDRLTREQEGEGLCELALLDPLDPWLPELQAKLCQDREIRKAAREYMREAIINNSESLEQIEVCTDVLSSVAVALQMENLFSFPEIQNTVISILQDKIEEYQFEEALAMRAYLSRKPSNPNSLSEEAEQILEKLHLSVEDSILRAASTWRAEPSDNPEAFFAVLFAYCGPDFDKKGLFLAAIDPQRKSEFNAVWEELIQLKDTPQDSAIVTMDCISKLAWVRSAKRCHYLASRGNLAAAREVADNMIDAAHNISSSEVTYPLTYRLQIQALALQATTEENPEKKEERLERALCLCLQNISKGVGADIPEIVTICESLAETRATMDKPESHIAPLLNMAVDLRELQSNANQSADVKQSYKKISLWRERYDYRVLCGISGEERRNTLPTAFAFHHWSRRTGVSLSQRQTDLINEFKFMWPSAGS